MLSLGLTNFGQYVTSTRNVHGGVQVIVKFPNGYGASIIDHRFSNGLELAVLDFAEEIDYTTPVTDDVISYLDMNSLIEVLNKIKALEDFSLLLKKSSIVNQNIHQS